MDKKNMGKKRKYLKLMEMICGHNKNNNLDAMNDNRKRLGMKLTFVWPKQRLQIQRIIGTGP